MTTNDFNELQVQAPASPQSLRRGEEEIQWPNISSIKRNTQFNPEQSHFCAVKAAIPP
jgi:hypothetical protein